MTALIDIALLILIGVFAVAGFKTGFMRGALHLMALLLGLEVAATWYPKLAQVLIESGLGGSSALVAFVLIVLGTIIVTLIGASIVFGVSRMLPRPFVLRRLNEALGVIPGVIKGLIIAAFVIAVIDLLPQDNGLRREVDRSRLGNQIRATTDWAVTGFLKRHAIRSSEFDVEWSPPKLPSLPKL